MEVVAAVAQKFVEKEESGDQVLGTCSCMLHSPLPPDENGEIFPKYQKMMAKIARSKEVYEARAKRNVVRGQKYPNLEGEDQGGCHPMVL